MSGPCLCGDPYCPSCGSPDRARIEAAEEALLERLGKVMTPADSKVRPELFLHDACLPDELRFQGGRPMSPGEQRAARHGMNCPASSPGNEDECTCGLKWRDALATEQTMHAAWRKRAEEAEAERDRLLAAIREHHSQKADDRCIEDDDRLYAAAGLPPCDRRVGDKAAMLENCRRFIERRCEGGGWPTYAELEARVRALEAVRDWCKRELELRWSYSGDPDPGGTNMLRQVVNKFDARPSSDNDRLR